MKQQKEEFKIPPVSTLIGSTIPNFFRVLYMGKPGIRFYPKLALTFLVILISTPFQIFEYFFYKKKVANYKFKKPPIFVIGHWRSGTTHLHNLLCKDPTHSYVTTYQGVFPYNLKSKWIFKTFMKINIPDKRPSDNVKLSPDYPQEEEFALSSMIETSFYHFFYFPSLNDTFFEKYIRFNGLSKEKVKTLKRRYNELLVKADLSFDRDRLVIKNPVNTGRIKFLLELYPDAKFIHIYRDPVTTFFSTVKFFNSLFPTTSLENYQEEFVKSKIIQNYKKLMSDYFEAKELIPKENLYEIKFEEFETNSLHYLKEIYDHLHLDSWNLAEGYFKKYVQAQKSYKKNAYKLKKSDTDVLVPEWGEIIKKLGYPIPESLEDS